MKKSACKVLAWFRTCSLKSRHGFHSQNERTGLSVITFDYQCSHSFINKLTGIVVSFMSLRTDIGQSTVISGMVESSNISRRVCKTTSLSKINCCDSHANPKISL